MTIAEQVHTLRNGAGLFGAEDLLTLRLAGPDRVRFANGMLTNDVSLLTPGQAQRAVKADHKGKVQGVLRVRAEQEELLLDVLEPVASAVAGALMKLLIMDEATLSDASPERTVLCLHGPKAGQVLLAAGYDHEGLGHLSHRAVKAARLVRDDRYGLPGYELHVPPDEAEAVQAALQEAGARVVDAEAVRTLRIEAGVPIDGPDIDDDTIPLEARLDEALSFTKGCYVGQETIARAKNLGGVKHILVGLVVDGDQVPEAGAPLFAEGVEKQAGEVTSAVTSPTLGKTICLGYLRVAHQAVGTVVDIRSAEGSQTATVHALPFLAT